MTPAIVVVPVLVRVKVRPPVSVTPPVKVKLTLPPILTFPPSVTAFAKEIGLPLAVGVPPLRANIPVPRALLLPTVRVPELCVVVPEYVLLPVRTSVPVPAWVNPPDPLMTAETVSVAAAFTVKDHVA